MGVRSIEERFEAKVDRGGDHHRWLGTKDDDGTPQMKVDGRLTTARRAAWELARGPLPPQVTVAALASFAIRTGARVAQLYVETVRCT